MDKNTRTVLLAVSTSLSTCTEALLTCVKGSDERAGVDVSEPNDKRDYCTAVLDAEERMQQAERLSREDMRGLLQDVYDEGYTSAAEGVYDAGEKPTQTRPTTPDLIVTKGGVPFEDQGEGIREFKEACELAAKHQAADREKAIRQQEARLENHFRSQAASMGLGERATTQAPKLDWPCCTKPIGDATCLNCPYGNQARKVANEMDERTTVNGAKSGEEAVCVHGVTFREHCRGCDFGHKPHRFTSAHIDRSGRG